MTLCATLAALAMFALTIDSAFAAQCPNGEVMNAAGVCAPPTVDTINLNSSRSNTSKASPANPVPCPNGEIMNSKTGKCTPIDAVKNYNTGRSNTPPAKENYNSSKTDPK